MPRWALEVTLTPFSRSTRKPLSWLSTATRRRSNSPTERLAPFAGRVEFRHGDFREGLSGIAAQSLCYAIADLGVSSLQLDTPDRGFSFRFDAPLDMRMDPRSGRTASDILNTASEKELERILTEFGEEPKARAIARSIVMERRTRTRTGRPPLSRTWSGATPADGPGLDPSTRAFQALRIATNSELQGLDAGPRAPRRAPASRGPARGHRLPQPGRPHREEHVPVSQDGPGPSIS